MGNGVISDFRYPLFFDMYREYMGSNVQFFESGEPFTGENGQEIENLTIAYHSYGQLNAQRNNVIWVCHALTANSDCGQWWPDTVVEGGLLDPSRYFIICANKLGSCYGSSRGDFTVRDNIRAFSGLADHLGIDKIAMLIGGSTGGAQAMEWAIMESDRIERLALLAAVPYTPAWVVASSESQRMAIESAADKAQGVATARAISMLLYRGAPAYNLTQSPQSVGSYQRYQGSKLAERFDADCYLSMLHTLDSHNVGRGRAGVREALGEISASTTIIAISSDILFYPRAVEELAWGIDDASYHLIESDFGHDGFLIETRKIGQILKPIIDTILED